jgi:hypothetical protein
LEDVSKFPYLFARLLETGWNEADLAKLAGGNIIRVLGDAEKVKTIKHYITTHFGKTFYFNVLFYFS